MSEAYRIWEQVLGVREPWVVREGRLIPDSREIHLWIGMSVPRNWFGLARRPIDQEVLARWRHCGLGEWALHLHVAAPEGADLSRYPWAGEVGSPFTHGLARRVFALLEQGYTLNQLCLTLELPIAELWRYRHALDNGRLGAEGGAAVAASGTDTARVPDAAHAVWNELTEGRLELDVRVLALKLLLTRVRSQLELISDDEVRRLKRGEVHRYFVKNARMLGYELQQLQRACAEPGWTTQGAPGGVQ